MKEAEFKVILEDLTPKQRKVLQRFLRGDTDEAIADALYLESSTIRRHLANIGKAFKLNNEDGQHYSYRENLIGLFARFQPELVSPEAMQGGPLKNLEFPGSPLSLNSVFYVERNPEEERSLREIIKPGALIRIRAPQRMGKTSLLNRILAAAQSADIAVVRINLRQAELAVLETLDSFLQWFCSNMSHRLNLVANLDEYWDAERFGSLSSCTVFIQSVILEAFPQGIVLGLDDVDWLFEYEAIAQGFFTLLRSWHEEANNLEVWQRLRLVIAHSTEVYIPLQLNQSPFNVGLPIRLTEFPASQVRLLSMRYGLRWSIADEQNLMNLVGGHPYLLQLAFYHLQQGSWALQSLLQTAPTQAGIYRDHLRRLWQLLQEHPELQQSFEQVIQADSGMVLNPQMAYQLESVGLVKLTGDRATVTCDLYRQYFLRHPAVRS
ncbi:AAA-like domain-containing protein [Leptolyngbya sp. PL-A3]|uniref:AAA-like domain-containing protein n=1 Tax=Leptolyngbya sp. PL-A3 TaxID=2933911 RepID=UPI003298AD83